MNIFIGCSSSNDLDDKYYNIGKEVSDCLSNDNDLVFGAYNSGIMGICYETFKNNNRMITGIVNRSYEDNLKELDCDLSILTDTTYERTNKLFLNSDILLFLPGGIGTISELFSALEEKRNGLDKPIIIYNENNLYKEVLHLLDKIYENKLSNNDNLYIVIDNTKDLKQYVDEIKNIKIKDKKYE